MPFVGLLVGASVHVEWLVEPEPIDIAPWIVYSVLGVSALLGVLCAGGQSAEIVEDKPDEDSTAQPSIC